MVKVSLTDVLIFITLYLIVINSQRKTHSIGCLSRDKRDTFMVIRQYHLALPYSQDYCFSNHPLESLSHFHPGQPYNAET